MQVWLSFLDKFNGNNIFSDEIWVTNEGLQLLTDSSGSLGCRAFFQNKWIVLQWPTDWNGNILQDITFLELVHIVSFLEP
jgi:hypothetical protein